MPRPKVHDESLRDRLLEQAGQTLSAQGLAALSLRKLAAEVGTSTTAVYSLFGGKPALLKALVDEAFHRMGTHLARVQPGDDPIDDLVALGFAYRDSALADPHLYDVMFGGVVGELPFEGETAAAAAEPFGRLIRFVERAIDRGALRSDADPGTVSLGLWAVLHGLVSLQLRDFRLPAAADPSDAFETVLRTAIQGWQAR
ncbi:TetR/AcrR family transcriptional regulator [Pseudonocardia asaccharolytica]|uniref:TetR family transcriptional regulator n=1 Tax=Pseudonocardia asaccharolytica DSM 44247 = NBRC 16224 TaxID=1123024 RepID=A0A511CUB0_9PSEU|nr:TetR-like C-terminal domain-containing protein [Pseudonocardia asaccharolytica]GEL16172.1 TetR family transcriptional regulator [Pseudonocardia asaccharolytica DSM 44247 = NBRC 16224]